MASYRQLIQHGAILFLLAAVAGWLMVAAPITNPRMMLGTHTTALLSALFMIVIGLLGPKLKLGPTSVGALVWSLVVSQYLFFVVGVYSAFAGTSSMFAGPPRLERHGYSGIRGVGWKRPWRHRSNNSGCAAVVGFAGTTGRVGVQAVIAGTLRDMPPNNGMQRTVRCAARSLSAWR